MLSHHYVDKWRLKGYFMQIAKIHIFSFTHGDFQALFVHVLRYPSLL